MTKIRVVFFGISTILLILLISEFGKPEQGQEMLFLGSLGFEFSAIFHTLMLHNYCFPNKVEPSIVFNKALHDVTITARAPHVFPNDLLRRKTKYKRYKITVNASNL